MMRLALILAGFMLAPLAGAQSITTHYDPNGGIVERVFEGQTAGTRWAYTTSNGQWYSTPSGDANVARAVVGREVQVAGATVAGETPVLLASEFTAANLAKAAIPIVRGGVAGLVVAAALQYALNQAHLAFDGVQQSMVYNPDPTQAPPDPGGPKTQWSFDQQVWWPDQSGACNDEGIKQFAPDFVSAYPASASDGGAWTVGCHFTIRTNAPAGQPQTYPLYREALTKRVVQSEPTGPGPKTCPNGVSFSDTTQCKQAVLDTTAAQYLTPHIDQTNGPAIGQNLTANNGIQFQSSTGVNPGPTNGPGIDVDANSWPQASGPAAQSFGPTSTTTSSSSTITNASGNPVTTSTTTTVANTTNVTNNYAGNSSTTNVTNTQQTKVCDASGVCSNSTQSTSGTGSANAPDDQIKVCGLPGNPPCKIDETGTPTDTVGPIKPGSDALDAAQADQIAKGASAVDSTSKDTLWKFSFAFPSNCAPLVAWEGLTFDICRFQPVFHDLMSMVWYSATVFLIIGMFGRTIRGGE